jgi:hypothetical protein
VNLAALASMARAPAKVANARISTQLEYDTTISWEPSADPELDHYVVLARHTTSAAWEKQFKVGNESRAMIPLSKDDHIFAIQAVDRAGHASIPVMPMPGRATTRPATRRSDSGAAGPPPP